MADPTKKRRSRKAYLEDFHRNARGDFEYHGAYYRYLPQTTSKVSRQAAHPLLRMTRSYAGALALLWSLGGLELLAAVAVGCIPAAGMGNAFYVILPYAGLFAASVSLIWLLGRLSAGGNPLREYVYLATVKKLPGRCLLTAGLAGATLILEAIHVICCGFEGHVAGTIMCFFFIFLCFASSILLRCIVSRLQWAK